MGKTHDASLNPHYDFESPDNLREIAAVEAYDILSDNQTYMAGQEVSSPWGKNQVLKVWMEGQTEFCLKRITINPHSMLSLQRHRARAEQWFVMEGRLTVILDGKKITVEKGHDISIPLGSVHCMINETGEAVVVEEIQKGICREKDNIRLKDFLGRATYPLTSEVELQSYHHYCDVMNSINKA